MLSEDTKERIYKAYINTNNPREVAKYFSIAKSTLYRIVKQYKETGNFKIRTSQRGRKSLLTKTDIEAIKREIEKQPDVTMNEIKERLNLSVHPETIRKKVIELGFRRKKKSIYAAERERSRC